MLLAEEQDSKEIKMKVRVVKPNAAKEQFGEDTYLIDDFAASSEWAHRPRYYYPANETIELDIDELLKIRDNWHKQIAIYDRLGAIPELSEEEFILREIWSR